MNFGQNLKNIRKQYKLSQHELAEKLNVSQRTISHYEKGYSEPTLTVLCKIADYFECNIDFLVRNCQEQAQ